LALGQPAGKYSQPDPIHAYLQPLVDNHTLSGAVVLVANRDSTLYLRGIGYRDVAARAPMPTDAMFWIASTSKPMTATAFMMLVDEGKVHLDDPVEKYLPEFKGERVQIDQGAGQPAKLVPANHPITIREILSHTSGLRFRSAQQPGALDLLPLKDQVRSFAAEPLLYQPGTSWQYSNEGLDTAARIIEVITGTPYEQFMQQRLFDPLGMHDTTFWPNAEQISRLATSYELDAKTHALKAIPIDQLTYPLSDHQRRFPMPAGGLFSTATDLSKFCRMILNGGTLNGHHFVSAEAIHEMTTRQNDHLSSKGYGLGWSVSPGAAGHGGAYSNAMDINFTNGRIFLFMVQQNGAWGTPAGDAMISTLEHMADQMIAAKRTASR
jgi:CubicO group peptidase (beta-lactamase class C family)